MKTIKELNEKAWYRFLKVLYVSLIIPYVVILIVNGVVFVGEIRGTYSLYSEKGEIIIDFEPIRELTDRDIFDEVAEMSLKKALALEIWKWFLRFILVTLVYFSAMEFLRRSFYYVVMGKVFPKE